MGVIGIRSRCSVLSLALALAFGATGACSSSNAKSDAATGSGGNGAAGSSGSGGGGSGTGGSGTGGSQSTDAARDQGASLDGGMLALTSTAFNEGQTVPALNSCSGANTSPPLTWTAGPAGTMSYAVFLTDLTNATIHWVIWDIPAATNALPAALALTASLTTPAGAKQAHHVPFFGTADNGYRGPCPSGALHSYQFEVHALDVATLPSVTTTSTPPEVKAQVTAHSLAHGDLTGTSTASMAGQ